MTVAVKVRPLLDHEVRSYERVCVRVVEGCRATQGPDEIIVGGDRSFCLDHIFSHTSDGGVVFEAVGRGLIETFLEGYNCTVFAYGQTGAGKTHTMQDFTTRALGLMRESLPSMGWGVPTPSRSNISLSPPPPPQDDARRTRRFTASDKDVKIELKLSVLEIYNEQVLDLLDPARPKLSVREGADGEVFVAGLREATVDSFQQLEDWLQQATSSRVTASTSLNVSSSRSHCVATISLTQQVEEGLTVVSKLNIVDLAGSERIKKAHAQPNIDTTTRVREGISINGGLLALGNVINALSSAKATHVPFRASKLTRILQSSLAGNSKTVMIACVSCGDRSMDETLSTLKYANRAKALKTSLSKKIIEDDQGRVTGGASSSLHADLVQRLSSEVEILRHSLITHGIPIPNVALSSTQSSSSLAMVVPGDATRELQCKIISLEEELLRERRFSRTLEEDLFRAEFTAMREVERRRQLEEELSALRPMMMPTAAPSGEAHSALEKIKGAGPVESCDSAAARLDDECQAIMDEKKALDECCHALVQTHGQLITEPSLEELEVAINTREALIRELESEREGTLRTMEEYQCRLRSVLLDKQKLQAELQKAEERLEQSVMEKSKRELQKGQLKSSFEAKLRAAEVSAAEYRRRVKETEQLLRQRQEDQGKLQALQQDVDHLREAHRKLRDQSKVDQDKMNRLMVSHHAEVSELHNRLAEMKRRSERLEQQLAKKVEERSRLTAPSSTGDAKQPSAVNRTADDNVCVSPCPPAVHRRESFLLETPPHADRVASARGSTVKRGVEASSNRRTVVTAFEALEALEEEIREAESERDALRSVLSRAQQSSDTARWRRAMQGFSLRLEQVEAELSGHSAPPDALKCERRELQRKMMQLNELRPSCDEATECLREVEDRIDSLNETRKYRMKVLRALKQEETLARGELSASDAGGGDNGHVVKLLAAARDENARHKDRIEAQDKLIEELRGKVRDQSALLQQLLPVSKEATRRKLFAQ